MKEEKEGKENYVDFFLLLKEYLKDKTTVGSFRDLLVLETSRRKRMFGHLSSYLCREEDEESPPGLYTLGKTDICPCPPVTNGLFS